MQTAFLGLFGKFEPKKYFGARTHSKLVYFGAT